MAGGLVIRIAGGGRLVGGLFCGSSVLLRVYLQYATQPYNSSYLN